MGCPVGGRVGWLCGSVVAPGLCRRIRRRDDVLSSVRAYALMEGGARVRMCCRHGGARSRLSAGCCVISHMEKDGGPAFCGKLKGPDVLPWWSGRPGKLSTWVLLRGYGLFIGSPAGGRLGGCFSQWPLRAEDLFMRRDSGRSSSQAYAQRE